MADFRKLLVALIAGALLFGSVASALDYGCSARAVPTMIRAESIDDFVGDIVIDCSGDLNSSQLANGITVNIRAQLNTTITSRLLTTRTNTIPGSVTEGTLILDNANGTAADLNGSPIGYDSISGNVLTPFLDGSQNVYQAIKVPGSDTEIEWQGVVLVGPGSNPIHTIRLTNIRARAAGIIPAGGIVSGTVIITTPSSVAIFNNKMDLAYVRPGLMITYPGVVSFNNCDFLPLGNFTENNQVVLAEGFGTAFKPRLNNLAGATPHYVPGGDYFDESGYQPDTLTLGSLVARTSIGRATTGTQFAVIVSNIPAGVDVHGDTPASTTNGLQVERVSSTFSSSGTVLTLIYEVMGYDEPGSAQFLQDLVTIEVDAEVGPPTAIGTMTVHARFNPLAISSTLVAVVDSSPDNDNNPRFVDADPNTIPDFLTIGQNCKTLLLFPYLTGQLGYESGIAITNTSVDPIVDRQTVAQAGACILNFYGQQAAAKLPLTAAMATQTSVTIPAGGQMTLIASGGLASGTVYARDGSQVAACATSTSNPCTGIPAFQGYMIATCNFQYAHGFAFVTDTRSDRTQGYLALVIPYRVINDDGEISRPPVDSSFFALPNQGENLGN